MNKQIQTLILACFAVAGSVIGYVFIEPIPLRIAATSIWVGLMFGIIMFNDMKEIISGESNLFDAIAAGNLQSLRKFLKEDKAESLVNEDGNGPLCWAILQQRQTAIRILLEHGFDPNQCDPKGGSPIRAATIAGHYGIIEMLLKNGADPNRVDERGGLALHEVCHDDRIGVMELLLKNGVNPNLRSKGRAPLHLAARMGNLPAMLLLLDHGADVDILTVEHRSDLENISSISDYTPLREALQYRKTDHRKRLEAIELLLNHGADPMIPDRDGVTVWEFACKSNSNDILDILLPHVGKFSSDILFLGGNRGWPNWIISQLQEFPIRLQKIEDWQLQHPEQRVRDTVSSWVNNSKHILCFLEPSLEEVLISLGLDKPGISEKTVYMCSEETQAYFPDRLQSSAIHIELPAQSFHTPWKELSRHLGLMEEQRQSVPQEHYKVFLSYKSKDVQWARFITEQLVARGQTVWFAEFNILLASRQKFQQAINSGIRSSDYAICLTNRSYAASEYCQVEIAQFLDAFPADRILEIAMPSEDHQFSSALHDKGVVSTELDEDKPEEIWQAITGFLGLDDSFPKHYPSIACPDHHELPYDGVKISLDLPEQVKILTTPMTPNGENETSLADFIIEVADQTYIGNLSVGRQLLSGRKEMPDTKDDRQLLNHALTTFRYHAQTRNWPPIEMKGVHLVLAAGGGHPGFTYRAMPSPQGNGAEVPPYFVRHYSLYLPHPQTNELLELCFMFRSAEPSMTFGQLCGGAGILDSLLAGVQIK